MTSVEILDAVMAKLHGYGISAEYYFSYGEAVVVVAGVEYKAPMLKVNDREAECANLLQVLLSELLNGAAVKFQMELERATTELQGKMLARKGIPNLKDLPETTAIVQLNEHEYIVTVCQNGIYQNLRLDKRTLEPEQLQRLGKEIEALANQDIHDIDRIG